MNKKLTFIITLLNRNTSIEDLITCVNSIGSQEKIEKEILLLTSFEGNIALEGELKAVFQNNQVIHKNYPNQTCGELRNIAVERATGDYVCFVNPSDFIANGSIHALLQSDNDLSSDVIIGHSMNYNQKNKTITAKEESTGTFVNVVTGAGNVNPVLLNDIDLSNKIFKTSFIQEKGIKFSHTDFYNEIPFQLNTMICAERINRSNVHFYNTRIYSGLDALTYPTMEKEINEQQVTDALVIATDIHALHLQTGVESITTVMEKYCVDFVLKRGVKYLNISKTPEVVFKNLAQILVNVDIEKFKPTTRKRKVLEMIQGNQFTKYKEFLVEEKRTKERKTKLKTCLKRDLFVKLYEVASKMPVSKGRVLFISHSPGMDGNYSYIQGAIKKHNETVTGAGKFTCRTASTSASNFKKLFLPFKLARAEFVVAAEHVPFFPLLNFREETNVVQTWHAAGAFKKFGYSTNYLSGGPNPFENKKMHLHRGYDYATVSSEEVRRHYAEAFDMDIEKVIPVGLPRADFFFDTEAVQKVQETLYTTYPKLKDKKVILYAPTFRGVGKKRANFEMKFDCNTIAKNISDDYVIALKLHPSVKASDIKIDEDVAHKIVDVSAHKDANDVLTITDLLITDYSSIIFDYSLLNKPMMFYAYDLDDYRFDRDFYYQYENFVPGPIAQTNEEVIELINKGEFDLDVVKQFSETFFTTQDGTNSDRFVKEVLVKLQKKEGKGEATPKQETV